VGLFDYYRPTPDIECPVCGQSDLEWQGTDGPCALLLWAQGQAAPIDQLVEEECQANRDQRNAFRLPARFEIFADCHCPTSLAAVGVTEQDVWTHTELLSPRNAVAYPHESERQFQQRLAHLARRSDGTAR